MKSNSPRRQMWMMNWSVGWKAPTSLALEQAILIWKVSSAKQTRSTKSHQPKPKQSFQVRVISGCSPSENVSQADCDRTRTGGAGDLRISSGAVRGFASALCAASGLHCLLLFRRCVVRRSGALAEYRGRNVSAGSGVRLPRFVAEFALAGGGIFFARDVGYGPSPQTDPNARCLLVPTNLRDV